jgi:hypothetical protein
MTEETSPRPFVFVLMPFSSDFDDTYRLAIKPACEQAGAYAERVDEQIFDGSILQRIFNQIAKADIIVSDLTGRNANVFYETGYAHALGKRTLLLTKNVDDIPFDLKDFSHIVYGGRLTDLLKELEKKVRWYIENPAERETTPGNLIVRVNSVPLMSEPRIRISTTNLTGGADLTLDIHNSVDREIRKLTFQLGLITPEMFRFSKWSNNYSKVLSLEDGNCLHLLGREFTLLPGSWDTIGLTVSRTNQSEEAIKPSKPYPFAIRVFMESGFTDFPFLLTFSGNANSRQKKINRLAR